VSITPRVGQRHVRLGRDQDLDHSRYVGTQWIVIVRCGYRCSRNPGLPSCAGDRVAVAHHPNHTLDLRSGCPTVACRRRRSSNRTQRVLARSATHDRDRLPRCIRTPTELALFGVLEGGDLPREVVAGVEVVPDIRPEGPGIGPVLLAAANAFRLG
jgi:hypothetical protein